MKLNLKLLLAVAVATVVLATTSACSSDPVKPEDETKNKLHDDPVKARLTFETVAYDSTTKTYQRQNFAGTTAKQVVEFAIVGGQWSRLGDTVRVLQHTAQVPVSYLLHIDYYDAQGQPMNYQFVTNGQDVIHQHFFMPENVYISGVRKAELRRTGALYHYDYLDTTPYDREPGLSGVQMIGGVNPIGFRGVLQFTQADAKYDMFVWLLHALNTQRGKYLNDARTELAPYYRFTQAQLAGGSWDIQMPVPVRVQ